MEAEERRDDRDDFARAVLRRSRSQQADPSFRQQSSDWMTTSARHRYSYNFEWLGLPIIQYPQDIVALQEIVWRVKPTLIVETGVARGGSVILSASLLALLDATGATDPGRTAHNPGRRCVIGVDIDIRPWNRAAVEDHPLSSYIRLVEGSSTEPRVIEAVKDYVHPNDVVMVILDSNHTHDHVLAELRAYARLTSPGSYCIVFDTLIEHLPPEALFDRPWGMGNSPLSAVAEFLREEPDFIPDEVIDGRLMLSVAPGGFLWRRPLRTTATPST